MRRTDIQKWIKYSWEQWAKKINPRTIDWRFEPPYLAKDISQALPLGQIVYFPRYGLGRVLPTVIERGIPIRPIRIKFDLYGIKYFNHAKSLQLLPKRPKNKIHDALKNPEVAPLARATAFRLRSETDESYQRRCNSLTRLALLPLIENTPARFFDIPAQSCMNHPNTAARLGTTKCEACWVAERTFTPRDVGRVFVIRDVPDGLYPTSLAGYIVRLDGDGVGTATSAVVRYANKNKEIVEHSFSHRDGFVQSFRAGSLKDTKVTDYVYQRFPRIIFRRSKRSVIKSVTSPNFPEMEARGFRLRCQNCGTPASILSAIPVFQDTAHYTCSKCLKMEQIKAGSKEFLPIGRGRTTDSFYPFEYRYRMVRAEDRDLSIEQSDGTLETRKKLVKEPDGSWIEEVEKNLDAAELFSEWRWVPRLITTHKVKSRPDNLCEHGCWAGCCFTWDGTRGDRNKDCAKNARRFLFDILKPDFKGWYVAGYPPKSFHRHMGVQQGKERYTPVVLSAKDECLVRKPPAEFIPAIVDDERGEIQFDPKIGTGGRDDLPDTTIFRQPDDDSEAIRSLYDIAGTANAGYIKGRQGTARKNKNIIWMPHRAKYLATLKPKRAERAEIILSNYYEGSMFDNEIAGLLNGELSTAGVSQERNRLVKGGNEFFLRIR